MLEEGLRRVTRGVLPVNTVPGGIGLRGGAGTRLPELPVTIAFARTP